MGLRAEARGPRAEPAREAGVRLVCGGAAGLCGGRSLRALRVWAWGAAGMRVCGSAGMRAV